MDDQIQKLIPSITIVFLVIIFLFICLYYNFIEKETIHYGTILRDQYSLEGRRISNIYKTFENDDQNIIYIKGKSTISNNLNDKTKIEIQGDDIYTITITKSNNQSELNLWNNSKTVKNLYFDNSFKNDDNKFKYFYTLNVNECITIENNSTYWEIVGKTKI